MTAEHRERLREQAELLGALSVTDRLLAVLACALAAVIFRYAGRMCLWPGDPVLLPSLAASADVMVSLLELCALAWVCSALAVAIAGRRLPAIGVMAVGVGLLGLGLKDADWRLTVAFLADGAGLRTVEFSLLAESLGWLLVALAGLAAEHLVRTWLGLWSGATTAGDAGSPWRSTGIVRRAGASAKANVWLALAVGLAATVATEILVPGEPAFEAAQGYFLAGLAAFVGVVLAYQIFPSVALWPAATGWVIPAMAGYMWGLIAGDAHYWFVKGVNPLADLLPIQYAAGGLVGAVAGYWTSIRLLAWRLEVVGAVGER